MLHKGLLILVLVVMVKQSHSKVSVTPRYETKLSHLPTGVYNSCLTQRAFELSTIFAWLLMHHRWFHQNGGSY